MKTINLKRCWFVLLMSLLFCPSVRGAELGSGADFVKRLGANVPQKVVIYGTSLTAGGAWSVQMKSWLSRNTRGKLTIINRGLSGKNSGSGVIQLESLVIAENPDVVFIEFSMNDAFQEYTDPTQNLTVAQAQVNLEYMIDRILENRPSTEIILQTMNTVWGGSAVSRPQLADYYQMYRDVADARGLLLIDNEPAWAALQANDLAQYESYVPDGTHPVAAGYEAVVLGTSKLVLSGSIQAHDFALSGATVLDADICVYGGTAAGVAAAVEASRLGKSSILLTPTTRFGGMTSSGLGLTDIGDPEAIGGIAQEFYRRVYWHYMSSDAWEQESRAQYIARSGIDPDDATEQMYTFEPGVAATIFKDLLAESNVSVVYGRLDRNAGGVIKDGATITSIATDDGLALIRAKQYIDATYEGDLMAAAGVSYTVGRESNATYSETFNGVQTQRAISNQLPDGIDPYIIPGDVSSGFIAGVDASAGTALDGEGDERLQAYCYRMCLTNDSTNRVLIDQPTNYDAADFELLLRVVQAGQTSGFFKISPMPNLKTDSNNRGAVSMDYIGGNYNLSEGWNYAEASYSLRETIEIEHRYWQEGLLWTLQNHPRVPEEDRIRLSEWGRPLDEYTENDLRSPQLYVREARRMVNDHVQTQNHLNQTPGFVVEDPVGMGSYAMDSHNVRRHVVGGMVKNEGDVQIGLSLGAYGIAYRALTPRQSEVDNLLVPVCLAASHIAYGSIRMEPVFMILGESAATAAAQAIDSSLPVQLIDKQLLQQRLLMQGQVLPDSVSDLTALQITMDNSDPGVTLTGNWLSSAAVGGYYGDNYLHDNNTNKGASSVTFTPDLPEANTYAIYLRWAANANRSSNVPVDIVSGGFSETVYVNQQVDGGKWVKLLTTDLPAGSDTHVIIRNDNTDGYTIADAVLFGAGVAPIRMLADIPLVVESSGNAARVMVRRAGNLDLPLNVYYNVTGSATNGVDYEILSQVLTIPAQATTSSILIHPRSDRVAEGSESVVITLLEDAGYDIGDTPTATLSIRDCPLDQWKLTHFTQVDLADQSKSGDDADPDTDYLPNLLEFVLGTDPHIPNSGTTALELDFVNDSDWTYPTIRIRQSLQSEDVGVFPSMSTDLLDWDDPTTAFTLIRDYSDGADHWRHYRSNLPLTVGQAAQFFRLELGAY